MWRSYLVRGRELLETLKMRALLEGSCNYEALAEFLRLYRDAAQLVINSIWGLRQDTINRYST